ncbi:MAG: 50S ribosomal protein L29 [Gemmatimonadota bacterium]|nr:MAG: 50S ribosomal protein L29 [Gemmatimonadota bacterium]
MTLDELRTKLDELSEDQFNLKFRLQTQPLDDPLRIRKVRRDIARVKTLIQEKQSEAATAGGAS